MFYRSRISDNGGSLQMEQDVGDVQAYCDLWLWDESELDVTTNTTPIDLTRSLCSTKNVIGIQMIWHGVPENAQIVVKKKSGPGQAKIQAHYNGQIWRCDMRNSIPVFSFRSEAVFRASGPKINELTQRKVSQYERAKLKAACKRDQYRKQKLH